MRKFLTVSLIIAIGLLSQSFLPVECGCGEKSSGVTVDYQVAEGEGCLTGTPVGSGWVTEWAPNEGGTYSVVRFKKVSGATAQQLCTPSA